jgi:cytoskeletal protein CcmA (bactofilin family)
VPNLVLNGSVNGDVYASEHIQLAANARIKGNVYYKVIEIARGAQVNGSLIHHEENKKAAPNAAVPNAAAPAEPAAAAKPKVLVNS